MVVFIALTTSFSASGSSFSVFILLTDCVALVVVTSSIDLVIVLLASS